MFEALLDPVVDDVHEERVRTERGGDEVTDTGVSRRRPRRPAPGCHGPSDCRARGNTVRSRPFLAPAATHASNAVLIDGAASSMCAGSTIG